MPHCGNRIQGLGFQYPRIEVGEGVGSEIPVDQRFQVEDLTGVNIGSFATGPGVDDIGHLASHHGRQQRVAAATRGRFDHNLQVWIGLTERGFEEFLKHIDIVGTAGNDLVADLAADRGVGRRRDNISG